MQQWHMFSSFYRQLGNAVVMDHERYGIKRLRELTQDVLRIPRYNLHVHESPSTPANKKHKAPWEPTNTTAIIDEGTKTRTIASKREIGLSTLTVKKNCSPLESDKCGILSGLTWEKASSPICCFRSSAPSSFLPCALEANFRRQPCLSSRGTIYKETKEIISTNCSTFCVRPHSNGLSDAALWPVWSCTKFTAAHSQVLRTQRLNSVRSRKNTRNVNALGCHFHAARFTDTRRFRFGEPEPEEWGEGGLQNTNIISSCQNRSARICRWE